MSVRKFELELSRKDWDQCGDVKFFNGTQQLHRDKTNTPHFHQKVDKAILKRMAFILCLLINSKHSHQDKFLNLTNLL